MRQVLKQNSNIVEKILRDSQGNLVRVTFCIYEYEGRVKARVVKVEKFNNACLKTPTLVLSGFVSKKSQPVLGNNVSKIVSPYFSTSILFKTGSKPRAPTIS
jgi:hypothetical protein